MNNTPEAIGSCTETPATDAALADALFSVIYEIDHDDELTAKGRATLIAVHAELKARKPASPAKEPVKEHHNNSVRLMAGLPLIPYEKAEQEPVDEQEPYCWAYAVDMQEFEEAGNIDEASLTKEPGPYNTVPLYQFPWKRTTDVSSVTRPPTEVGALPEEPTEEMIDAMADGYTRFDEQLASGKKLSVGENLTNVYRSLRLFMNRLPEQEGK